MSVHPFPSVSSYLPGFEHSVLALAEVCDHLRPFHATVCLDGQGWVRDLTIFDHPDASPDDALDWAEHAVATDLDVVSVVLWSADGEPVVPVAEDDVSWFLAAQGLVGSSGAVLDDWVRTDGEVFRSMAITCGTASPRWLAS